VPVAQLPSQLDAAVPITGVDNDRRLRAAAEVELVGHEGDQGLDAVVATLHLACNVPIAVVNIVTVDMQTYPAEVGVGAPCTTVADELSFCATVVDCGTPLTVADASTHPQYSRNPLVLAGDVRAYAGEPLLDNGFVIGAVSIFDRVPREFTTAELEILHHQALLASTVLALRRSARTDALTELPNRSLFVDRLSHALDRLQRHPDVVSVMFLDVDHFKGINDLYGHDVGDAVLVELSTRLKSAIRTTDTLARLGGDEFVALCEDLHNTDDARLVAAHMIAAVDKVWTIAGQVIPVSISIGVAVADSPDVEPAVLLRDADASMYQAKKQSGSAFVLSTSRVT
jgi:diguanylate cyclase (GGDEF)-like protein